MDSLNLLGESAYETGTEVATHKGFPNPSAERGKTPLSLDKLLIKHPASSYLFRVRGHQWHRLGVFDGDTALIDRSLTAHHGSLVIWWDEAGSLYISQWRTGDAHNVWGVVTAIIHIF